MKPLDYFLNAIKNKYVDFNGRARRSEYWYFVLFNVIISIVANVIDMIIGYPILGMIVGLALLVPGIAVAARRLHDVNKSGWLLLIAFIPLLGLIALIYFMVQDSDPGENQYGPNPKSPLSEEDQVARHLVD